MMRTTLTILVAVLTSLLPAGAAAHDASAWGGLFRTRDGGASWFQASSGKVMGGALSLAVDPHNADHLLLGTDSGLLGSSNGGRDWDLLVPDLLTGAVLAVAVDADGHTLLAASASTLAETDDGASWHSRLMPVGASPPRSLVPDTKPAAYYLLGWSGLFHTEDAGASWSSASVGLPGPVTCLLVSPNRSEGVLAIAGGAVWSSADGGRDWEVRSANLPASGVQALAIDPASPDKIFASAANRLFTSDDAGHTWSTFGGALPESGVQIHGIVAAFDGDPRRMIVSTDRGLYMTGDAAVSWDLLVDNNLPGHIEAGPLVSDGRQPTTLYAGFSVTPYAELWQNAAAGSSALARLGASELAGAAAFVILIILGATLALRLLARRSRAAGVSRELAG